MPKFAAKLVWVLALAFLLSATVVFAQTNTTTASTDVGTTTVVADDQLQGIAVEGPKSMPTQWGLWWRGAKERLTIWTTINPVKKAEKQLQFAEERMRYAEYISANATDPKRQAWAEKMVDKANKFMEKVEATKEKWQNNPEAQKRELLRNLATHQVRKEKILDKIEEKLPADKLEAIQKLRVKSIENGQRLINAISNTNIPTSTREHLQAVKNRVEDHLKDVREFQKQKQDLKEKIKSGDTTASATLQKLNQARKAEVKANLEKYKQILPVPPVRPNQQTTPAANKPVINKPVIKSVAPAVSPAVKAKIQVKKLLNKPATVGTSTQLQMTSTGN